jgi:hypothetical protein
MRGAGADDVAYSPVSSIIHTGNARRRTYHDGGVRWQIRGSIHRTIETRVNTLGAYPGAKCYPAQGAPDPLTIKDGVINGSWEGP